MNLLSTELWARRIVPRFADLAVDRFAAREPEAPRPGHAPRGAAVFIDKDGALVEHVPHNVDPARLRFTPHALEGLRLLADAGYALVVVTRQPGLASGRFSRAEFSALQRALAARLREQGGIELAGFYTCPHAPGPGGAPACLCRMPAPGLLRQAARAQRLDLARSWMLGDVLDHVEAGRRAGCRSVLIDVGSETAWRLSPLRTPEQRCADLREAARHILAGEIRVAGGLAGALEGSAGVAR